MKLVHNESDKLKHTSNNNTQHNSEPLENNADDGKPFEEQEQQGLSVGACVAIGIGVGVAIGAMIRNLAVGVAFGLALGLMAGSFVQHRKDKHGG